MNVILSVHYTNLVKTLYFAYRDLSAELLKLAMLLSIFRSGGWNVLCIESWSSY